MLGERSAPHRFRRLAACERVRIAVRGGSMRWGCLPRFRLKRPLARSAGLQAVVGIKASAADICVSTHTPGRWSAASIPHHTIAWPLADRFRRLSGVLPALIAPALPTLVLLTALITPVLPTLVLLPALLPPTLPTLVLLPALLPPALPTLVLLPALLPPALPTLMLLPDSGIRRTAGFSWWMRQLPALQATC